VTAAVLLHPHPDLGGDQHNPVVTALYERLPSAGITPYRFDFASSELGADRRQAIEAIEAAGEPVVLVGYSFGGGVAATVEHPAIIGWGLIAPALSQVTATIGADARPKYVVTAEHDAWFGPPAVTAATAGWISTSRSTISGTDHFFGGPAARDAADLVARWAQTLQ
jgi:alpha/beta superfamily hydrolase